MLDGVSAEAEDSVFDCNAAVAGGGLFVTGDATASIARSTFHCNGAYLSGGALHNDGGRVTLFATDVAENNASTGGGGGVYHRGGVTTVDRSTIRGNRACAGAGVEVNGPETSVLIFGTTISGNSADCRGGGVFLASGSIGLIASTVVGNQVTAYGGEFDTPEGAGLSSDPYGHGEFRVEGTIVAANRGAPDCGGTPPTSRGYNFDGGTSCGFTAPGDVSGTDPGIGPLGENGGPTMTHALLPGSPALDRIPPGAVGCGGELATDQRGMPRPGLTRDRCDIGAYER